MYCSYRLQWYKDNGIESRGFCLHAPHLPLSVAFGQHLAHSSASRPRQRRAPSRAPPRRHSRHRISGGAHPESPDIIIRISGGRHTISPTRHHRFSDKATPFVWSSQHRTPPHPRVQYRTAYTRAHTLAARAPPHGGRPRVHSEEGGRPANYIPSKIYFRPNLVSSRRSPPSRTNALPQFVLEECHQDEEHKSHDTNCRPYLARVLDATALRFPKVTFAV